MKPRIGIMTYGNDSHGHLIKKKLEEQHDAWCCLVPCDQLALRGGLSWSTQLDEPALLPTVDGKTVDAKTLDVMWYRRTSPKQRLPEGADDAYSSYINASVDRVVEGILLDAFVGRWVSHPVATKLAENKQLQLRAAERAGLRVPATLVSQDPERIRRFCAAYPGAIIKQVASPRGIEVAKTAVAGPELLASDEVLALTPSIYQECIAGERHLRISVCGDRCDGALIEAKELDWRCDLNIPFSPYRLDGDLEERLRATLRDLSLAMGIFDVKLTDDGEPVFLEINSQGQFLFVEALCGLPLADHFAAFLVDEAKERHVLSAAGPTPDSSTSQFG
ncbi:MAG TPA: hypothetical protein VN947_32860 [Polyangia bacterium]|nr:hypothetical protein [Polyangia bacterium]